MKLLYLFLLSVLFCTSILGAQEVSPPGDQDLSKPVTLAVKGEALSDIMAMLSKQTGLKLRGTKDIADQKATIFVDRKPLKYVLGSLCTIFGYRLSMVKQSDGSKVYEVWESPKTKLARETATSDATAAAWQELDRRIRENAALTPSEQEQSRKACDQILAKRKEGGSFTPEEQARLNALSGRFGSIIPIAKLYTRLSPTAIQALQSGASIYFDTSTSEPEWRIPQDIDSDLMARVTAEHDRSDYPGRPSDGYNIEFQPLRSDKEAYVQCLCTADWRGNGGKGSIGLHPCPEIPVADAMPEQQVRLPSADDDGTLAKQFAFTAKELGVEADLYGQTERAAPIVVNRSDVLSLLHRRLGLQSISDHHSYWFGWNADGSQTVKDLLDRLPEMVARSDKGKGSNPIWGWDGNCVLMRERFPYRMDAAEPPNRVVRRLREDLAQDHLLDFDDVVEMAALAASQAGQLLSNWGRLIKVSGGNYSDSGDMNRFALADPAMKLYAHLTDAQKRAMRANGVSAADLMPNYFDDLATCFSLTVNEELERLKQGNKYYRRVGIYRDDIRLDKPEPGGITSALIQITRQESQHYNCWVADVVGGPNAAEVNAQSPEAAWQQCQKQIPALADTKRSYQFGRDMGYVILFIFPDGTRRERPIPLCTPVTVGK